jgi:acetolactate synthase-1/2/3 large subunit
VSSDCHTYTPTAAMLQSHSARQALQCLPRARRNLSSSSRVAALSPYNRGTSATQAQTTAKRNVSAKAALQSQAATASSASATRTVPSPAFNREDSKLRDVQPLQPYRQPELDHSFVGKNGGEIFHEMMLRQGVKHVCK